MNIPVFIFFGFLDAGKTNFIQELLEGDDFVENMRTLVIVCEEGISPYQKEKFVSEDIFLEYIEDRDDFNAKNLDWLQKKHRAEQILIEYNGMWDKETLANGLPAMWNVVQQAAIFESKTFISYNKNMRQLVYEKLNTADMIFFNRSTRDGFDMEEYHKIVRAANNRALIIYEYEDGTVEQDNIPDPPPYDLDAEIVKIRDDDFAFFLRDLIDSPEIYDGKVLEFKGRALCTEEGNEDLENFAIGRHVMTCCVEDISFQPIICEYAPGCISRLKPDQHGDWFVVRGKMTFQESPIYDDIGPILVVSYIRSAKAADPELATF